MGVIKSLKFIKALRNFSKKRLASELDYLKFQEFQAMAVHEDISKILKVPAISFVIDFGCGKGGYTKFLASKYRNVLGIDFYVKHTAEDNRLFQSHNLLEYNGRQKADFIFCASVIEHTEKQDELIKSIKDNLKTNGSLYLGFPPFFSIGGGHQLKPFHYLPEKLAVWLGKKNKRIGNKVTGYKDLFGSWGLYKTSISKIKRLLKENNFRIIKCKTRFLPINTANIPILGEFLTWHAEFYCKNGG